MKKLSEIQKKAVSDTIFLVILTGLQTIFSLVLYLFGDASTTLTTLYDEGELILYAISFSGSAFIIDKQLKNSAYKNYGSLSTIWLFILAVFYTTAQNVKYGKNLPVIFVLSIGCLIVSLWHLYISQVKSNKDVDVVIEQEYLQHQKKIEDSLS